MTVTADGVSVSGPMGGRTVLVTGGTSGIGRATALGLAGLGAHIAITGRDRERTEDAAREIRAVGGGRVDVFVADLSSQSQVRRLADEVLRSLSRIDVLLNNVGGYWNTPHATADGLERTFAVNHLAPFLLTNLLLDRLKQNARARVVTVSSHAHATGRINFDDLQGERSYSGARAYDQSKLANVLFTYELARRLPTSDVTANALHPGVVNTSFGAEDPGGVQRLLVPFMRPFMKAGPGRRHVDPPGFCSRSRPGHGLLLRQRQAQEILRAQLRRGGGGPALGGERRSGRPGGALRAYGRTCRLTPTRGCGLPPPGRCRDPQ